mmetsp:Transcript_17222/g.39687  ORF Transcript_17222/g.39687 Transcript_17222/m.39687 type:complete len:344 (+) Transcript_17222:348-1379(+)
MAASHGRLDWPPHTGVCRGGVVACPLLRPGAVAEFRLTNRLGGPRKAGATSASPGCWWGCWKGRTDLGDLGSFVGDPGGRAGGGVAGPRSPYELRFTRVERRMPAAPGDDEELPGRGGQGGRVAPDCPGSCPGNRWASKEPKLPKGDPKGDPKLALGSKHLSPCKKSDTIPPMTSPPLSTEPGRLGRSRGGVRAALAGRGSRGVTLLRLLRGSSGPALSPLPRLEMALPGSSKPPEPPFPRAIDRLSRRPRSTPCTTAPEFSTLVIHLNSSIIRLWSTALKRSACWTVALSPLEGKPCSIAAFSAFSPAVRNMAALTRSEACFKTSSRERPASGSRMLLSRSN